MKKSTDRKDRPPKRIRQIQRQEEIYRCLLAQYNLPLLTAKFPSVREMKLAASRALADIVAEPMPAEIRELLSAAYPEEAARGIFEGEIPLKASFVIPKPFDPRVVPRVARLVAEAAMKSGVARVRIDDLDAYERSVAARIARNNNR